MIKLTFLINPIFKMCFFILKNLKRIVNKVVILVWYNK